MTDKPLSERTVDELTSTFRDPSDGSINDVPDIEILFELIRRSDQLERIGQASVLFDPEPFKRKTSKILNEGFVSKKELDIKIASTPEECEQYITMPRCIRPLIRLFHKNHSWIDVMNPETGQVFTGCSFCGITTECYERNKR